MKYKITLVFRKFSDFFGDIAGLLLLIGYVLTWFIDIAFMIMLKGLGVIGLFS
jgi:hypothetical protein